MKRIISLLLVSTIIAVSRGDDRPLAWPQFRGPNGSGVADSQKPPVEFGPDKNVKWKVPVPSGVSSPIVAGDNLVMTAFEDGKLYTIAYRRADGKEAWRAAAPAKQIEPFHKTVCLRALHVGRRLAFDCWLFGSLSTKARARPSC